MEARALEGPGGLRNVLREKDTLVLPLFPDGWRPYGLQPQQRRPVVVPPLEGLPDCEAWDASE